jgi:hypothetical protein
LAELHRECEFALRRDRPVILREFVRHPFDQERPA